MRRVQIPGMRQFHAIKPLAGKLLGLTAARAIGQACSMVASILLARWLGPTEFGAYAIAISIFTAVSGVFSLGIPAFALRAAALGQMQATGYSLFLNVIMSTSAAIIGTAIAFVFSGLPLLPMILIALAVAIESNGELRVGLGTEFGYTRIVNIFLISRGILVLLGMLLLSYLGLPALTAFLTTRAIVVAIAAFWLMHRVNGPWRSTSKAPTDGSLRPLKHMGITSAFVALKSFDVAILGAVASATTAGLFSAVTRITMPIGLLSGSLSVVAMGPSTRSSASKAKRTVYYLAAIAVVGLAIAGVLSIWSTQIVTLIFGAEFKAAAGALRWILIGVPALGTVGVMSTVMQAQGRTRDIAWQVGVTSTLSLILVPVLAVYFGATGAAMAFAIVLWLGLILRLNTARQLIGE